ncbi:MAG: hypothetical protein HOQ06_01550 [Pseudarthrobacter sp.]|nr:hypothetical protein [Pseudarthrobacter sp.]
MPDRDETEEPLESLPAGIARGYAEYKLANDKPSPRPTSVGGYDELLGYFRVKALALPRSRDGLVLIDSLIDDLKDNSALTGLAKPIGMFYGDVLTHAIPGAHWEVIDDRFPTVRISRKASISVIHVAQRRLMVGLPTLAMNYDHARDLTS